MAAETPEQAITLRRGRILVTRLALSGEALGAIRDRCEYHEKHAIKRRQERSPCQQVIAYWMAAL